MKKLSNARGDINLKTLQERKMRMMEEHMKALQRTIQDMKKQEKPEEQEKAEKQESASKSTTSTLSYSDNNSSEMSNTEKGKLRHILQKIVFRKVKFVKNNDHMMEQVGRRVLKQLTDVKKKKDIRKMLNELRNNAVQSIRRVWRGKWWRCND